MTLPLTKDMLRAAYNYLNETPPFNKWNLPDGDDVTFQVADDKGHHAWLTTGRAKRPVLAVSRASVGHTITLMSSVAHEMAHLYQYRSGMPLTHGPVFKKLAAEISAFHGFDPKSF